MKKSILIVFVFIAQLTWAQGLQENFWVTNGKVHAVKVLEDDVVIGGNFSYVGPYTPHLGALDLKSNKTETAFPGVGPHTAKVYAITSDGNGGWFIGGKFEEVGGIKRKNLAHIRSDYSVSDWAPSPDGIIHSIEVDNSQVYVGGDFTVISEESRKCFAAFSKATLQLNQEFQFPFSVYSKNVRVIKDYDSLLVVGGYFSFSQENTDGVMTQYRNLVVIDKKTGKHINRTFSPYGQIYEVAFTGTQLFCTGRVDIYDFSTVVLAGFNYQTGLREKGLDASIPGASVNMIYSMAYDKAQNVLFLGGNFSNLTFNSKTSTGANLVAIDLTSRQLKDWAPAPNEKVSMLKIRGDKLYVTGKFTTISSQNRQLAAYAIADLSLDPFTCLVANGTSGFHHGYEFYETFSMGFDSDRMVLGGEFTSMGGVARKNLASLNRFTGKATAWHPQLSKTVQSLAVYGDTVLVGCGDYNTTAAESREYLLAFTRAQNAPLAWQPAIFGEVVLSMAVKDNILIIGGIFSKINGEFRTHLASFNLKDGSLTPFKTNLSGYEYVNGLAVAENLVMAIGRFDGKPMWSFDITTGKRVSNYTPSYGNYIETIEAVDSLIYASGVFGAISQYNYADASRASYAKNNLLAVNAKTGKVTDWRPVPQQRVLKSVSNKTATYYAYPDATYDTISIAAYPRNSISKAEDIRKFKMDYDMGLVLAVHDSVVYLAGSFWMINGQGRPGIVAIPYKDLKLPLPQNAAQPAGLASICKGSTSEYTVSAVENAKSYLWRVSPANAGQLLESDFSNRVSIRWADDFSGEAKVSVLAENEYGQGQESVPLRVSINAGSDAVVSFENGLLTASEGAAYQWKLNDVVLVENTRSITPKEPGNYLVVITDPAGCQAASAPFYVDVQALSLTDAEIQKIALYPNPVRERLFFEPHNHQIDQIIIYDLRGVIVKQAEVGADFVDLSGLKSGIYYIKLLGAEGTAIKKIVKL